MAAQENSTGKVPRIIIVGGGAGGIELATHLGDRLGKRRRATVTLVDRNPTHVWKPLLHEVAAGSMDIHKHQLDYVAQARWHHFRFQLGALQGIDRTARAIAIGPVIVEGAEMLPRRTLSYDVLVIAVGSNVNHFGVPGAVEHTVALDSSADADRLHRRLITACVRANAHATKESPGTVEVAIIGAGATGVELAAEMRSTTEVLAAAEIVVWAAGIKAPDILTRLDGLETTRLNQLVVGQTLQTSRDAAIRESSCDEGRRGLKPAATAEPCNAADAAFSPRPEQA